MKNLIHLLTLTLILAVVGISCEKESASFVEEDAISQEVIDKITLMGFNPDGIVAVEEGYRIERDIIITHENLKEVHADHRMPEAEQYRTFNTVSTGGNRTISVYISVEGSSGGGGGGPGNGNGNGGGPGGGGGGGGDFPAIYGTAVDEAIARFNAENLDLSFVLATSSSGADIVVSRLNKRDERRGVLGSAGFPTSSGDPFGSIQMSGVLASSYGLDANGIATIMAHEMGHCIGFRHTDYFDRSISCGGGTSNEGAGSVGAEHIPGTPTGASLSAGSWMLSCSDGSDRPFNNDDQTALGWMYNGNF